MGALAQRFLHFTWWMLSSVKHWWTQSSIYLIKHYLDQGSVIPRHMHQTTHQTIFSACRAGKSLKRSKVSPWSTSGAQLASTMSGQGQPSSLPSPTFHFTGMLPGCVWQKSQKSPSTFRPQKCLYLSFSTRYFSPFSTGKSHAWSYYSIIYL